jgi:hypothetical protein
VIIGSPSEQFERGYRRGLHDGRTQESSDQDFAYKSADYERGYWAGFKAARRGESEHG